VAARITNAATSGSATAVVRLLGSAQVNVVGPNAVGAITIFLGGPFNRTGVIAVDRGAVITVSGTSSIGVNAQKASQSTVDIAGTVTATGEFAAGVVANSSTQTNVTIASGATVTGGWQANIADAGTGGETASAVLLGSDTRAVLANGGVLTSRSDKLVGNSPGAVGAIEINNFANMTGFWNLAGATDSAVTNNAGAHIALRHFADTDGNGVRDTKRVAISDFGDGTTGMFLRSGSVLSLAPVSAPVSIDAANYYVPANLDASFYDFNRSGLTQAHLVNLDLFSHSGVIDLRGSGVGNSLVITGAASVGGGPGVGVYRADGGTLLINSILNAGQSPGGFTGSESDVLVVDRTELGTGATQIFVDRRTGLSGQTPGNGILVVELLLNKHKLMPSHSSHCRNDDASPRKAHASPICWRSSGVKFKTCRRCLSANPGISNQIRT
jgi:hypothetical protein